MGGLTLQADGKWKYTVLHRFTGIVIPSRIDHQAQVARERCV